jgi:hypothetical protein
MSGTKGHSGRRPKYVERSYEELKHQSLDYLMRALSDKNCPDEWKRNANLAIALRGMPTKQEQSITLIPQAEQMILDKYSKPLPDNTLTMITGSTASGLDNNIVV